MRIAKCDPAQSSFNQDHSQPIKINLSLSGSTLMSRKYIITVFFIVVAVLAVVLLGFRKKRNKDIEWKTFKTEKGNIQIEVTATGSVNPLTTVQVGTQVSGTISRLYADFNSVVKKGQVIALIDTVLLSATKHEAEAAYTRAKIQLNQSKTEFDRMKKLYEGEAVSKSEYDLAVTNYESAQSQLASARSQLERAKINVRYATIHAPINGTVISRNVDLGQTVIASFNTPTLFTIANDLTKMQVYANIDEADIGQVKVGQTATFTVDAFPNDKFTGFVKQIRLQPNTIQNVVTYTVIIDVANPDLKLMPGLTANIYVNVKERKNTLKIPASALRFFPPPDYLDKQDHLNDSLNSLSKQIAEAKKEKTEVSLVWVKRGDEIIPKKITTGISDGNFLEVKEGIAENDEVITGIEKDPDNKKQTKNPFMPSFSPGQRRGTR